MIETERKLVKLTLEILAKKPVKASLNLTKQEAEFNHKDFCSIEVQGCFLKGK